MKKFYFPLLIIFSVLLTACELRGKEGLDKILASGKAPVGVVFEVASDDKEGLKWLVPMVKSYSAKLRKKFPGIKLALVSHGDEQFQLTQNNAMRYAYAHQKVKILVNEEGIPFHICANNAASQGVSKDAFVKFVDVVEQAPQQIAKYKKQGYVVLILHKVK